MPVLDLIDVIQSDLLKSAELTGQWEYKLRLIEKGEYDVKQFKEELTQMVVNLTNEVIHAQGKQVAFVEEKPKAAQAREPKPKVENVHPTTLKCPKCKQGMVIEGKKAYGCANYQSGCNFVLPFIMMGKKLTPKQIVDLIEKGKTTVIKGFSQHDSDLKKNGKLVLTSDFNLEFEEV